MPSHYTVVQFVPDPIIEERINIGVIAFAGAEVHSRFLSNWKRARGFGGQDVAFLQEFAAEVARAGGAQLVMRDVAPQLNEQALRAMAGRWANSIQFTTPRASLLEPSVLAQEMAARFLRTVEQGHRGYRTRRVAISLAVQEVESTLVARVGVHALKLVQRELPLQGLVEEHHFDVGVKNGKPLLALNALSFEGAEAKRLENEIGAMAWAIDDVRKVQRNLPIAVVFLPPRGKSAIYERARRTFKMLHADTLTETRLASWTAKQARRIARHV